MAQIPLSQIPNAPDLSSMSAPQVNNVNVPNVDFSGEKASVAAGYASVIRSNRAANEDVRAAGMVGASVAEVGQGAFKLADSYMDKQKTLADKQQKLETDVAKIDLGTRVAEFNSNFWTSADYSNYQTLGNQYAKRFDEEVTSWAKSQPEAVQQGMWLNVLDARSKGFAEASHAAHQQDLSNKFVTAWDGIVQKANRWDSEGAYADAEKATQAGLFNPKQKEEIFATIEATKANNFADLKIQQNPEAAAAEFNKAAETGESIPGMESLTAKEYSNKAKLAENVYKYQQADRGTAVYSLIDSGDVKTLAQLEKTQSYQQLSPEWKQAAKSKLLNEVLADTPDGNRAVGDSFGMLAKFAAGKKGDLNLDYEKLTRMAGTLPAADSKQFLEDAKELYQERVRGKGDLPPEIRQRYEMSNTLYNWYKGGVFGSPENKSSVEALKKAESDWKTISARNQGTLNEAKKEFMMQHRVEAARAALIPGESRNLFFDSVKENKGRPMGGLGSPRASNDEGESAGKITKYGYEKKGEKDYDSNSARGIGAADNKLTPNESVALSPDLEKSTGAKIGDKVVVTLSNGEKMVKRFDDRTSKRLKGRVDIYSPDGNQPLDGVRVAKVEKYTEDGQG
jgi:hypothetical protein